MEDRPTCGEGKSSKGTLGSVGSARPLEGAVVLWPPSEDFGQVMLAPFLDSVSPGVNPREECKVQEKLYLGSCV